MELCQEVVLQKSVLLREQVYVFVTWPWDCKSGLLGMEHSKSLRSQCSVPRSQIPGPRPQNPRFQIPDPRSQLPDSRSQIGRCHIPNPRSQAPGLRIPGFSSLIPAPRWQLPDRSFQSGNRRHTFRGSSAAAPRQLRGWTPLFEGRRLSVGVGGSYKKTESQIPVP